MCRGAPCAVVTLSPTTAFLANLSAAASNGSARELRLCGVAQRYLGVPALSQGLVWPLGSQWSCRRFRDNSQSILPMRPTRIAALAAVLCARARNSGLATTQHVSGRGERLPQKVGPDPSQCLR